ncbi:uncharacterized protein CTRU02_213810 [Colletotrichum truncatum]|uniref:Uncharacterized protein n=1 Tax=Colletotrichum truncatum TaxID=5467 RepID=A0ACC3YGR6_COLTU|nr:uncharacterized protein CTRU02_12832 [Colletotrichum truncatum]KAF6784065.1 hypothetical protein CTRU02_12832 [Colletotrichum truncatum]
MKFVAVTASIIVLANPIAAGVAPATAAEECGSLGVMTYTDASLLEGVDLTQIRTCRDHPLGPGARPSAPPAQGPGGSAEAKRDAFGEMLVRQEGTDACWYGDSTGCTNGYCWKTCGDKGRWCWTAWNKGWGNWRTCSKSSDCKKNSDAEGGEGGCKACGCSC